MSALSNTMLIAIHEAKGAAESESGNLEAKLTAAMKATKDHWLITSDDERIRAAVGGVMLVYGKDSKEYARLEQEMNVIRKLNAMLFAGQQGLSVDIDENTFKTEYEPIGILKLWEKLK